MNKNRLEAFSDGVMAIIITIMVLEIKAPEAADWSNLKHILPTLFAYLLSFIYVGIYWNNHHHLLHTAKRVTPALMWANHILLFCLSLVPFGTKWMHESSFAEFSVMIYAILLLLCAISFTILTWTISRSLDKDDHVQRVLKIDAKSILSMVLYAVAIPLSFLNTNLSIGIFVVVAIIWLIPSKAIEKELSEKG